MGTFPEVEFIHCGYNKYHQIGISISDAHVILTLMSAVCNLDHDMSVCLLVISSRNHD